MKYSVAYLGKTIHYIMVASILILMTTTTSSFSQTLQENLWIPDAQANTIAVKGDTAYVGGFFRSFGPSTGSLAEIDRTTGYSNENFPKIYRNIIGGDTQPPYVMAVVPDGFGGWYIGGLFSHVNGKPRHNLAHINPDKTLDENWDSGIMEFNNGIPDIRTIAVSGTTVYVGGWFTKIAGQTRGSIAALDAVTGQLSDWNPNADWPVNEIRVIASTIYVAGTFTSIGGQQRKYLASFDAATGDLTNWNPNLNSFVYTLDYSDSILYVGGAFTQVGSVGREHIAAFNLSSGSLTSWDPGSTDKVLAIAVSNNTVYAGGLFNYIGGKNRNFLAAIDIATGIATNWNPEPNDLVQALAVSDGIIYAGGLFRTIGGQERFKVAAIDAVTGIPTSWNPAVSDYAMNAPFVITVLNDNVYIGGLFNSIGAQTILRSAVSAIDITTGKPTSWDANLYGGLGFGVSSIELSGNTLYISGDFVNVGGQPRFNLAAVDALTGDVLNWSPSPNGIGSVACINIYNDIVYVGGTFTLIDGVSRNGLAAIDAITGDLTSWNPDVGSGWIQTLTIDNNIVYAGGYFSTIGGEPRNNIAAIDLDTGVPTSWDPGGTNDGVFAIEVANNNVYLGGTFTNIGGQERNYLAAVDASTGNVKDWNPNPNAYVRVIKNADTTIYVGGDFSIIGGETKKGIAAFDNSTGNLKGWSLNADGDVREIIFPYSDIEACMIAGTFRAILNLPYSRFAIVTSADSLVTSVGEPISGISPVEWHLSQNYPNPFNPSTSISFSVDKTERVELTIFNILGQEVTQLFNGIAQAGYNYNLQFDASGLPTGIYFYRLATSSRQEVKKMLFLK